MSYQTSHRSLLRPIFRLGTRIAHFPPRVQFVSSTRPFGVYHRRHPQPVHPQSTSRIAAPLPRSRYRCPPFLEHPPIRLGELCQDRLKCSPTHHLQHTDQPRGRLLRYQLQQVHIHQPYNSRSGAMQVQWDSLVTLKVSPNGGGAEEVRKRVAATRCGSEHADTAPYPPLGTAADAETSFRKIFLHL